MIYRDGVTTAFSGLETLLFVMCLPNPLASLARLSDCSSLALDQDLCEDLFLYSFPRPPSLHPTSPIFPPSLSFSHSFILNQCSRPLSFSPLLHYPLPLFLSDLHSSSRKSLHLDHSPFCIICIGDERKTQEKRAQTFCRLSKTIDHVEGHSEGIPTNETISCRHPVCKSNGLVLN